jgi:hypothetical protein
MVLDQSDLKIRTLYDKNAKQKPVSLTSPTIGTVTILLEYRTAALFDSSGDIVLHCRTI